MKIQGSLVAIVTPMNEFGAINLEKMGELIEFHIANQTDGIVILGTTGESPTLTFEEEEEIVKYCIQKINKRIPLIVGSGSNSTQTAIQYSMKYEALGADALLVITPYYNRTNNSGMIKHFEMIASSVNIPIILYNVPGRTGCTISIEALKVLAKNKNIIGIKEASGNIGYVCEVAKLVNDDFALYSGNDDQIVPLLALGGSGVISVVANILPRQIHNLVSLYLEGKTKESLEIQLHYLDLINHLFLETNPIPIKEAMNYLGFEVGPLRLPLASMGEANKERLIKEINKHYKDVKQ